MNMHSRIGVGAAAFGKALADGGRSTTACGTHALQFGGGTGKCRRIEGGAIDATATARYLRDRHRALQFGRSTATEPRSARAATGEGRPIPPRFYQTKPVVMLRKSYLCGARRMGYVDYRKMTTGFVFPGWKGRARNAPTERRGYRGGRGRKNMYICKTNRIGLGFLVGSERTQAKACGYDVQARADRAARLQNGGEGWG